MENLLNHIVQSGAEIAIIDIPGVPTVDTLVAQRSHEGRSFPMAMRNFANEPSTACPTIAPGHVGGDTGFVDKREASWIKPHLHLEPSLTRCGHVRPVLFCSV